MSEEVSAGQDAAEETRPFSTRPGLRLGYSLNRSRLQCSNYYRVNKRPLNIATLVLQYVLALLTLVLPMTEAVAVVYGSVSVLNGVLLALEPFYFQPQPVLINEGLFDIVFLVNLLFFSDVANANEEARIMLYVALAAAIIAVAAFIISYYIAFPTIVSLKAFEFNGPRPRAKYNARTNGILMFIGFVLTDCADFTILAVQDFSLAPFNPDDEVLEVYVKREKELKEKVAAVLAQEARSERKNVALTGVLAIIVFPVVLAVVLAFRGASELTIIITLLPLVTALPIWLLWKMMGIPWDKYMLMNDAWRTLLPRIIVVSWAIAMIVLNGSDLLALTLTLLLYSLIPLLVYFMEQFVRRTRLECTYRELGVFDDAGLRRLFRSRLQDKFRFLYEPPDAYKEQYVTRLCREASAFHPVQRFGRTLKEACDPKEEGVSKELGAVLEALTNVLTRSYSLDVSTFKLAGEEYESIKDQLIAAIPKLQQAYANCTHSQRDAALEAHWYCWCEALLRLGIDKDVELWSIVEEAQSAAVSSLEFSECNDLNVTADGLNELLATKGSRLKGLTFRKATFTQSPEEVFGDVEWFLSQTLKYLVLREVPIGDKLGARIVSQLPWQLARFRTVLELADYVTNSSCSLEVLDLSGNRISDEAGQNLAHALASNRSLTKLVLHGNFLEDGTAEAVAATLKAGSKLKNLWLSANKIEEAGAIALGEALAKTKELEYLTLLGNEHLNNPGVSAIGHGLKQNRSLRTLWLSNTAAGDESVEAIAEALSVNKTLTNLHLNVNEIKDQGVVALGNSLRTNTTLSTLEIKQNALGDNSGVSIGQALAQNTALTMLNFHNNQIADEGMAAIGAGLKQNKTLTYLSLRQNRCAEAGAIVLAEALTENSTLESLDLKSNQIPASAGMHLAAAVRQNASLTYLHLGYNRLGDEGVLAVAEAMPENNSLESLYVYSRALSPEALEQLENGDQRILLHKFK